MRFLCGWYLPAESGIMQAPMRIGSVALGDIPRVVGTVCRKETLHELLSRHDIPCDVVELRLDRINAKKDEWLAPCRVIEEKLCPVIVSVCLAAEGGGWKDTDAEREALFAAALEEASAVDIEFRSPLRDRTLAAAEARRKPVILSYHDFEGTPPLTTLETLVNDMLSSRGVIAKVATMVRSESDIRILAGLLLRTQPGRVCVMGMGPLGEGTRVVFPCLGSVLTYGYLDDPGAPGQWDCASLVELLRRLHSGFRREVAAHHKDAPP